MKTSSSAAASLEYRAFITNEHTVNDIEYSIVALPTKARHLQADTAPSIAYVNTCYQSDSWPLKFLKTILRPNSISTVNYTMAG